jgi:hypothetical protein
MLVRALVVASAALVSAPALAQIVIVQPQRMVIEPAPTISTTTRVVCRSATDDDFKPGVRRVAGVNVISPQLTAFEAGRCATTEASTTITRPLR